MIGKMEQRSSEASAPGMRSKINFVLSDQAELKNMAKITKPPSRECSIATHSDSRILMWDNVRENS